MIEVTYFCPATGCGSPCIADVASDSSDLTRTPDFDIGAADLEAFVNGFISENASIADIATDSSDQSYNPNGSVGPEDIEAFVNSFVRGC